MQDRQPSRVGRRPVIYQKMLPVSEFLLHALRRSTSCCASIDWRRWIPVSAFKVDPILLLAAFALCQGGNVLFRRYCMVDEAENRFRAAHFIVVAEVLRALGCAVAILFLSPRPKDDFALSVSGAPGGGKSVEDHRMEEEDDPARLPKKAARSARSDAWSGRLFPVQISKPPGEAASPFFRNVLPLALPAILYASQNQLQMYTVACLEASSYTLLMQTRVFFACAFSVFFFGRFINLYQQAGLLTSATALLLLVSSFPTEEDKGSSCRMRSLPPLSETQVACLVTVYCGFVAGFAGVITESFFKTPGWSFFVRNLQLAVFSVLVLFVYIECFARERGLVITRRNGARVVQKAATDAIGRRGAHVVPEAFEVGLGGTGDIKHGAVEIKNPPRRSSTLPADASLVAVDPRRWLQLGEGRAAGDGPRASEIEGRKSPAPTSAHDLHLATRIQTTFTLVCAWFFHGFTPRTWLMAVLEAGNTLFTGYVIQELDVVQCDLAQVGALLFVVIASSCGVFGAEGFVGGSGVLAMAALLLCAGMFLYNRGELYFALVEGASPRSAPFRGFGSGGPVRLLSGRGLEDHVTTNGVVAGVPRRAGGGAGKRFSESASVRGWLSSGTDRSSVASDLPSGTTTTTTGDGGTASFDEQDCSNVDSGKSDYLLASAACTDPLVPSGSSEGWSTSRTDEGEQQHSLMSESPLDTTEDGQEQDRERKLHEQRKFVAVYRATYGFSVMSAALVFVYLLYFAVFSIQPLHREGARNTGVRAKPKQLKPLIIEAQQQDNMLKQEVAKNDTLTNLAEGASVSLGIKIELESGDGAEGDGVRGDRAEGDGTKRDGAEGEAAVGKGGRNRSDRRGRGAKEREPEAESEASVAASGIAAARQNLLDDLRAGGGEDRQAGFRFGSRDEEKSPDVRRPDRGRKKDFAAEKAFRGFLMQAGTQKKGAR